MQFDWFLRMIYHRTDAKMTSPLTKCSFFITKTNRLHIDVRLNNKRYQKTSKFRKNISDRLGCK